MSMTFFPFALWFFFQLIWAGPHVMDSLTPYLTTSIPDCAHACLIQFIADNYQQSVCGETPSFQCLCVSSSSSGYTLGEGTLDCLVSACIDALPTYDEWAYEICDSVPNALPNTHSTLTATYMDSKTDSFASQITSIHSAEPGRNHDQAFESFRSLRSRPTSSASINFGQASLGPVSTSRSSNFISTMHMSPVSNMPDPATRTFASTSTSSSSPVVSAAAMGSTPSAVARPTPELTKPQVAGVVIASVGIAFMALGLCLFLCCLRRRKSRNRQSGSSFGEDKLPHSHGSTPDMAATSNHGEYVHYGDTRDREPSGVPPVIVTPAPTSWRRNTNPAQIGLALAPEIRKSEDIEPGHSPITPRSYRTNSQLLPEKPSYSLFPSPLRIGPNNERANDQVLRVPQGSEDFPRDESPNPDYRPNRPSLAPMSTPRFPGSIDTSQAHLQNNGRERNLSDPFYYSQGSPPQIYPTRSPRLQPRSPYTHPDFGHLWSGDAPHRPIPAHQSPSARALWPVSNRSELPSHSRAYPPPPPLEQHYLDAIERSHSRKAPQRRGTIHHRPVTWISTGSGTDIEDDGLENPPAPKSTLFPVTEMQPRSDQIPQRSSGGQTAHPTIPTSVGPSASNRPPRPTILTGGHASLAGGRLGEDKAKEIAGRLDPQSSNVRSSAKWKILVSPGLDRDINHATASPETPQTANSLGQHPAFR